MESLKARFAHAKRPECHCDDCEGVVWPAPSAEYCTPERVRAAEEALRVMGVNAAEQLNEIIRKALV